MLFRVPLAYTVTGTPKGKLKETRDQFWEYAEVDIPVISDEEAPVAVVWDDTVPEDMRNLFDKDKWESVKRPGQESNDPTRTHRTPADGIHMTRLRDGEHFIRTVLADDYNSPVAALTPDRLAAYLTPGPHSRFFGQDNIYSANQGAERPVEATPYRADRPFTSTFTEAHAALSRAASAYMIVDGEIFERSSEPVITVESYLASDDTVVLRPRVLPKHFVYSAVPTHRVDAWADVVRKCEELADSGFRRATSAKLVPPRVLISEAVNHDEYTENFINAARRYAANGISQHIRLLECNVDFGIAFLRLRKAVDAYGAGGGIEAVESSAHTLVSEHPRDFGHDSLRHALQAYQDRPVEVRAAFEPKY